MSAQDDVLRWRKEEMLRRGQYRRELVSICNRYNINPELRRQLEGTIVRDVAALHAPIELHPSYFEFPAELHTELSALEHRFHIYEYPLESMAVDLWETIRRVHMRTQNYNEKDQLEIYRWCYQFAEWARTKDIPNRPEVPPRDELTPDRAWKYLDSLFQRVHAAIVPTRATSPVEDAAGKSFLPQKLASTIDCSDSTVNKYAKLAGIPTPSRGKKDRYSHAQAIKIVEAMIEKASGKLAENARKALANLK